LDGLRISFHVYNTLDDVDAVAEVLTPMFAATRVKRGTATPRAGPHSRLESSRGCPAREHDQKCLSKFLDVSIGTLKYFLGPPGFAPEELIQWLVPTVATS
jgi:hypothetical protein